MTQAPEIGIVVIGRNEGERLANCLTRIIEKYPKIVYVDSGSMDGSVKRAKSIGVLTLELDDHLPFCAARARNEGFDLLLSHYPDIRFVQFVDGDCELDENWPLFARKHLEQNPGWAAVCGRRKERNPDKSIYNLLCDIEWDTPIGKTRATGGDFMIRASAFQEAGGFNASVIAGEEPELGFRLRQKGWQIWRLDHPMTLHDADMTKFSQWWKRMQRAGYASAQGAFLHFNSKERYCVREMLRPWLWAFLIPVCILVSAIWLHAGACLLLMIYLIQLMRLTAKQYVKSGNVKTSFWYSLFILIGKFPELVGQIRFGLRVLMKKKNHVIEYK